MNLVFHISEDGSEIDLLSFSVKYEKPSNYLPMSKNRSEYQNEESSYQNLTTIKENDLQA